VTLIQSNFGSKGNLELVARSKDQLAFFWRDSGPEFKWSGPFIIDRGVAGCPCMIQSKFGQKGNFELVVPLTSGGLGYYWRDNDDEDLCWHGPLMFCTRLGRADAVTFVQSNFGNPRNFELVVPLTSGGLGYYWRDNDDEDLCWHGPLMFGTRLGRADAVTFVQSNFGNPGNFELVVPVASGGFAHYWRNNDDLELPWYGPVKFGDATDRFNSASLIQSSFGSQGNLELATTDASGMNLFHFWRDSGPSFDWHGPSYISEPSKKSEHNGNPSLIQSRYGHKGNFDLTSI
jgi:hypothetical protein